MFTRFTPQSFVKKGTTKIKFKQLRAIFVAYFEVVDYLKKWSLISKNGVVTSKTGTSMYIFANSSMLLTMKAIRLKRFVRPMSSSTTITFVGNTNYVHLAAKKSKQTLYNSGFMFYR